MSLRDEPLGVDPVVAIYRQALPEVYGYLVARCGNVAVAEDLTAETFMAAVTATQREEPPDVTVGWLIGVARHKLVDHWRRSAREQRRLSAVAEPESEDPWEQRLDADAVHAALRRLNGHQRGALTLRYLDGLSVADVAECLGRSVPATETLLMRAKAALRRVYEERRDDA
ncbi:MAG: RNA polymerase sigma factor [Acidimicrobiaceae bacterium]|nr:RNA polymerase sigma factor [Acidimicrobiaceae bacterium]